MASGIASGQNEGPLAEGTCLMLLIRFAALLIAFMTVACASVADPPAENPPSDRRIAITFDDAPLGPRARGDWDRAGALIAALDAAGVQAAFFATTKGFDDLTDGRDRVARYAAAGHLIANHTHTHPWLHQTEADAYLADIDEAERRLSGLPNRRAWFRYPFLDQGRGDAEKRGAVWAGLAERGLNEGYVTADTYDWHLDERWRRAVRDGTRVDEAALEAVYAAMVADAAEHAYGLAEARLGAQPVHVLLLHENDAAAAFIGAGIAALREAGWTVVTPDEAYAEPLRRPDVTTGFTGAGRVAALSWEAGARGPEAFDHWSASKEGLDERLAREGAIPPLP